MERIIMIKGRRACDGHGSLHSSDRCKRWGAPVTGSLPVRFARMQHEVQGVHAPLHG
jgi:hypothetical protein